MSPAGKHRADLAIVGAGPAGLYATYYAGFRGLSVVVIDFWTSSAGRCRCAIRRSRCSTSPDPTGCVPRTWLTRSSSRPRSRIRPTSWGTRPAFWRSCRTASSSLPTGEPGSTPALLVAGGMGRFTPRPLPAGGDFAGRGLRYAVPRPAELAGRDVLIVDGG